MEVFWVAAREANPPGPLRDPVDPLTLPNHVLLFLDRQSCSLQIFYRMNCKGKHGSFYASESFQMVVGTVGVSQSSVGQVVRDLSPALYTS